MCRSLRAKSSTFSRWSGWRERSSPEEKNRRCAWLVVLALINVRSFLSVTGAYHKNHFATDLRKGEEFYEHEEHVFVDRLNGISPGLGSTRGGERILRKWSAIGCCVGDELDKQVAGDHSRMLGDSVFDWNNDAGDVLYDPYGKPADWPVYSRLRSIF